MSKPVMPKIPTPPYANRAERDKAKRMRKAYRQALAAYNASQNGKKQQKLVAKSGSVQGFAFKSCTQDYAKSLIDPWTHRNVCLPWPPGAPSEKVTCRARGFMTVNGNGWAWICIRPHICSDRPIGLITPPDFKDGTTPSMTGGCKVPPGALPITIGDSRWDYLKLTSMNQARIVSSGLRVSYIGDEQNLSGIIIPITEPNHFDLGAKNISELWAYRSEDDDRPTAARRWWSTTYSPVREEEYSYASADGLCGPGGCYMGIYVVGSPGQKYEYDIIVNAEVIGQNCQSLSASHSDMNGVSTVISGIQNTAPSMLQLLAQGARAMAPYLKSVAAGTFKTAATYFAPSLAPALPPIMSYATVEQSSPSPEVADAKDEKQRLLDEIDELKTKLAQLTTEGEAAEGKQEVTA